MSHRPLRSRSGTLAAVTCLLVVASGLLAPPIASARASQASSLGAAAARGVVPAARGSTGLASAEAHPIGRSVGLGIALDARQAARSAAASPRATVRSIRPRVDLGARRATSSPAASVRNLVRDSASALSGTGGGPRVATPLVVSQPAPVITTSFPGITQAAAACACEPPDPWIAVSSTHVVQTTNGLVRISTRTGTPLVSMPTWALFSVPVDRLDSDPRILWDQVHGRWLGVLTTFRSDLSASGLRLAVSETSDPTGAWTVYPIEFGPGLPDYPGISSSGSRIVLTSDDFLDESTWLGPTWIEMDWSNILAGTSLYIGGVSYRSDPAPSFGHFRPAIMLSSAPNTPVVYENGDRPGYFEIGGTAHAPSIAADIDNDLTHFGIEAFTLPPQPVQPGAVSIAQAVDDRPTDAVYRNGSLWFVATGDYDDGANHWDKARWTWLQTAANASGVTNATDTFLFFSGVHYFMPGVGINGQNSAIMVVTATDPNAMNPTTLVGGVLAGSGPTPFVPIETSPAAYIGDRWGDFLGIAADPAGAGAVWIGHELSDAAGDWRTTVVRVVSDGTPPGSPGVVSQVPVIPSTLGSTVPVRVSWGAAADVDSGVASYLVERSDDGGGYVGVATPASAITQALLVGHAYRYRVSAIDAVGNVGLPTYGPAFHPTLYQSTSSTTLTGTWRSSASTVFSGGSTRYSSSAGATATYTARSARSIAIVATKARTRGSFRVYVDGVFRRTVSTYATTTRYRQLVYQFAWSTPGTHRVKIVISGTSGHPRVDLDAFVVLR